MVSFIPWCLLNNISKSNSLFRRTKSCLTVYVSGLCRNGEVTVFLIEHNNENKQGF